MKHTSACPAGFQESSHVPNGLGTSSAQSANDDFDPSRKPVFSLSPGGTQVAQLPATDTEAEESDLDPSDNPWAEDPDHFDLYDAFTAFDRRIA